MAKNRCSLCGGKLRDMRCVECGLDNSKSDENYTINVSACDSQPLTHVHHATTERPPEKGKGGEASENTGRKRKPKTERSAGKAGKKAEPKKLAGIVMTVFVIFSAVSGLIPDIADVILDGVNEMSSSWEEDDFTEEYDPYEFVKRKLPAEGEEYEAVFGAGLYKVGADIPEGTYHVTRRNGMGIVGVRDWDNSVFYSEYLNEEEMKEIEDFRLYQGAYVYISDDIEAIFSSSNAQETSQIRNPLLDKEETAAGVELKGTMVAGEDFEPGVYDVTFDGRVDIYTNLEYTVPGTVDEDAGYPTDAILVFEKPEQEYCIYRNLPLPKGTEITLESGILKLVPSEYISSDNYAEYYDLYYGV